MHLAPVGTHLLAILTTSVEIGHLISTKHVVHVLDQLGLQRGHDCEFLANKDLGKQVMCSSEHHGLLLEVLNKRAFRKELGHITYLMPRLAGKHLAGTRKNSGTNKHGHIGKVGNQLLHQSKVLCTVFFCRNMNLQESNVNVAQVIVVSLWWVADEEFAFGIVVFQPIFQCSTHETTSDNSNVNHS